MISIIIPAKDEQKRLPHFLKLVIDYCRETPHLYELIIVDDGSKDQTAIEALAFQNDFPSLKVISLDRNYGKGQAVKAGFLEAKGDIVLFLDADGSTKPQEIGRHLHFFEEGYDIVVGSRVLRDGHAKVEALAYRRWIGTIFNFLVSHLLLEGIKDTQCGFKMFRSKAAQDIFKNVHLKGFGFDLEVLYLAKKMRFSIKEVAVNWTHVDGSKVHLLKDSIGMFWNMIQIKRWHR